MTERPVRRNETLRDAWFEAANEILATEGYGALKLAPLCKKLGVTTGSFYHSFDNWQDFTDSLLETWHKERTERLAEIARQDPDPYTRLQLLISMVVDFNHRAEAAIRVWAGVDERVAAIQRQVDDGRYQAAHDALVPVVGPELAPSFATWGLGTVVGFEMLSQTHRAEELQWSLERIFEQIEVAAKRHAKDSGK